MSSSVIEHAEIDFNLLLILWFRKYSFCACYTSLSLLSVPLILYFCCTEGQLVIPVHSWVSCALLLGDAEGYIESVYGYFFELICYS